MRTFFRALWAAFELTAAEVRTGIDLVEAVASAELDSEYRAVITDPTERERYQRLGAEMAKLGFTVEQVMAATSMYRQSGHRIWYDLEAMKGRITRMQEAYAPDIQFGADR